MEKKEEAFTRVWKVRSLDGRKFPKDVLPIDGGTFKHVKRDLTEKGYGHPEIVGDEKKYEHYSIRGLCLFINEIEKTVRAEGYSEAAVSQVINDFKLPAYRQD